MLLISVKVEPFKSINEPQEVLIDEKVTVIVGMNESGKTVFLHALQKSNDALNCARFDPVEDYPRKNLPNFLKKSKSEDAENAEVTALTYQLNNQELKQLNAQLHTNLPPDFKFTISHYYDNKIQISIDVNEQPVIESLISDSKLSSDVMNVVKKLTLLRKIPEALTDISLTDDDKVFLDKIKSRITQSEWQSVVSWEVWKWIEPRVPKFLYFSEYQMLPSKSNLNELKYHKEQSTSNPKLLTPQDSAILALLRMADISINDFLKTGGYETLKAKIEGISIDLTDQIMEFWKQNENLEIEIDIKPDNEDVPPYNSGPNLYIRIKNRRHRGVSTPFGQRSHGFIWFFSFLVWFDNVQHYMKAKDNTAEYELILLLDEPGLSLHAIAQADFLRYIDELAKKHQVLYTTHSPFMVNSNRLSQVRVIEDKDNIGTVISDNVSVSDPRTIFPLQAALGWTIAQNLFISERNLLVEGPSDLIYLKTISAILEVQGRTCLRNDVTIVPVGGLDKVVTFVALLGASGLKLAVLHDYHGTPEQRLMDLVKQKIISKKKLLNVAEFRDLANIGVAVQATDIEDLLPPGIYLEYFNKAFESQLNGVVITESDLPDGDRIIDRLERHIKAKAIKIRPSGGYNHYIVSSYFANHTNILTDPNSLNRFEELFKAVNSLLF